MFGIALSLAEFAPCRAAAVGIIAYLDAGAQAMVARTIKPYGAP